MRDARHIRLRQVARRGGVSIGTAPNVRRRILAEEPADTISRSPGANCAAQRWGNPDENPPQRAAGQTSWCVAGQGAVAGATPTERALLRMASMTLRLSTIPASGGPRFRATAPIAGAVAPARASSWLELASQVGSPPAQLESSAPLATGSQVTRPARKC